MTFFKFILFIIYGLADTKLTFLEIFNNFFLQIRFYHSEYYFYKYYNLVSSG